MCDDDVKDKMHQTIEEIDIIFSAIMVGRTFINEEHLKEKEGDLGFYRGWQVNKGVINECQGIIWKDGDG